jgi:hypothetical protein
MDKDEAYTISPIEGKVIRTSVLQLLAAIMLCAGGAAGAIAAAFLSWQEGKIWIKAPLAGLFAAGLCFYFVYRLFAEKSRLILGADSFQEWIGKAPFAHIPYANIAEVTVKNTPLFFYSKVVAIHFRNPADAATSIAAIRPAWFESARIACDCDYVITADYSWSPKALVRALQVACEIY